MTSPIASKRASSRRASGRAGSGAITPWAMWESRDPSTATTPQPVRRRPGSSPRMRIAFVMCSRVSVADGGGEGKGGKRRRRPLRRTTDSLYFTQSKENAMVRVTGEQLQKASGLVRAEARRAPVEVTYHGRPELVVLSV